MILSPLGAGGMGAVYRARDLRLGREVAVKVIAGDPSAHPERVRRFELEARALAALEHPHVLAVHDVGTQEGETYIVFELLAGETLRERLERGALPTSKAVELAVQIGEGLAAAHSRGIVHRDLKPENLFLTRDGRVKILDFGLAKLTQAPDEDGDEQPTATATDAGAWVGTPGYVSPEQLRGGRADARSDVFALGAVLYEMLTGQRAFRGASRADTLSAILDRDPPPMAVPGGPLPPSLERLVRRCLEKDPDYRFQSARDVAFALETLQGSPSAEALAFETRRAPPRRWPRTAASVAVIAAAAAGGLLAGRASLHQPLPSIQRLTFRQGHVNNARFTSDGKTVVYSAYWDGNPPEVFTTRVESQDSRTLGLPPARLLAVSSQAELAILLTHDLAANSTGKLARVPLSGGAVREVLDDVLNADWSPDGRELAVTRRADGNLQLEYPIGRILDRFTWNRGIRVSPAGDRVATVAGSGVVVYDRTGKKTSLKAPLSVVGFSWASNDSLWIGGGNTGENRSLRLLTLDGREREVYRAPTSLAVLDSAGDGRVLAYHGFERMGVRAKRRGEPRERELGVFAWSELAALSLDGTQIAIGTLTTRGHPVTYLQSTSGDAPVRLGDGGALALSPDGRWALIYSDEGKPILSMTPVGPGEPRALPADRLQSVEGAWFLDNERVLVAAAEPGRPSRTFLFHRSGGTPRPLTPEGILAIEGSAADGSIVGCCDTGRTLVRFRPVDGVLERLPAPLPGDADPMRLTADGRSLFIGRPGIPFRVDRFDLATGRVSPWKALRPDDLTGVVFGWAAAITPDGESYAYQYSRVLKDLFLIEGLERD